MWKQVRRKYKNILSFFFYYKECIFFRPFGILLQRDALWVLFTMMSSISKSWLERLLQIYWRKWSVSLLHQRTNQKEKKGKKRECSKINPFFIPCLLLMAKELAFLGPVSCHSAHSLSWHHLIGFLAFHHDDTLVQEQFAMITLWVANCLSWWLWAANSLKEVANSLNVIWARIRESLRLMDTFIMSTTISFLCGGWKSISHFWTIMTHIKM